MKTFISFLLVLQVLSVSSQLPVPFDNIRNLDNYNSYFSFKEIESSLINSPSEQFYWQAYGTYLSIVGRYDEAIEEFFKADKLRGKISQQPEFSTNQDYGLTKLITLADSCDVLLLNEAHHMPIHRATLLYLLPSLFEKGYRYLALEGLSNEKYLDSLINDRGFPVKKTGIYIQEPLYAELVTEAIRLGFELIAYDSYSSSNREKSQAENILESWDKKSGKLIVMGGYAHISKSPQRQMMGYYLSKEINDSIVSVNQVCKLPGYLNRKDFENFSTISCLVKDTKKIYDYNLLLAYSPSGNNIPTWYSLLDRIYVPLDKILPVKFESPQQPFLVQAFADSSREIPLYQYLAIKEKPESIFLALKKNSNYLISLHTEKEIFTFNFKTD